MTPADRKVLAERMATFQHDPLGFVTFAFRWGEDELKSHEGPRTWQREELRKLGERLRAGTEIGTALRLSIVSGNGVGKSAFMAWLTYWALSTMVGSRVVVTANTGKQLENKTWPELLKWHRRSINREFFTPTATSLASADESHARTWRADAVSWSQTNTEAFAGLHNQGLRLVLVFDEASGIDDIVWDVAEGAMTDAGTEILWLALGNYTRNTGRFDETQQKLAKRWHARAIDSRTVEGVNQALIKEWQEDFGEDSDFFRARVSAKRPRHGVVQFISSALVAAAAKRVHPNVLASDTVRIGVDVARFGDDESVIKVRRGRDARTFPALHFRGLDTMQLVGQVVAVIDRMGGARNVDGIFIDEGGVGGGVVDRLRQLQYRVIGVNNGAKSDVPTDEQVANKAAEMWARMRAWLPEGSIEDDPELCNQLENRQYSFDAHNRYVLERKADMKKRGVSSPDRADALALTFAYPMAPRSAQGGPGQQAQVQAASEYDPIQAVRSGSR